VALIFSSQYQKAISWPTGVFENKRLRSTKEWQERVPKSLPDKSLPCN
jgi:hypothetical protein